MWFLITLGVITVAGLLTSKSFRCGFTKPFFYDGPCLLGPECEECKRFFDKEGNRK